MTILNSTASGLAAIAMWSLLALFTAASGQVPPFQLLAMTFAIGAFIGVADWVVRGVPAGLSRLPFIVWVTGIAGLFGYHFFYYTALRNAPPAQAGLIAYLWPMLIVTGSALLPGERLHWYHLAGVFMGFAGAAVLISGEAFSQTASGSWLGYGSAFACAFFWSAYSIVSRTQKSAPTGAVAIYCLATAFLSAICHLIFETTIWPQGAAQWLAVFGLGLMPVGLAFYAWDYGVKHGNIQFLGSAAYFAPLLSTIILVLAGYAQVSERLFLACLLIVAGALIASGRFAKR